MRGFHTLVQSGPITSARMASTVMLTGLEAETDFIQSGRKNWGDNAVLMNSRGNVRKPAIPNTDSALLVFNPSASEIPAQANPKKAIVTSISNRPSGPVAGKTPNTKAPRPSIIDDWTTTLKASVKRRPRRIAGLLTGVANIFSR